MNKQDVCFGLKSSIEIWILYTYLITLNNFSFNYKIQIKQISELFTVNPKPTKNAISSSICTFRFSFSFYLQNCSYPGKFLLTDRRAIVPPLAKTVYLLRRKSCARFGLNLSISLLCHWTLDIFSCLSGMISFK